MELTEEQIQQKLNEWFRVLDRLAKIQADDPMAPAYALSPLREDVAECVERGWIMAYDDGDKGQLRLVLRPEG